MMMVVVVVEMMMTTMMLVVVVAARLTSKSDTSGHLRHCHFQHSDLQAENLKFEVDCRTDCGK